MNKEIVQVKYTENDKKLKDEIEGIDKRIKEISNDFKKENAKKYPNSETINRLNNETGYLIRHRNELVEKLYKVGDKNDKADIKTDKWL